MYRFLRLPSFDQFRRQAGLVVPVFFIASVGLIMVQWRQHGLVALSVQSNSMQPVFGKGDALVVGKIDPWLIRVGDVVSYPDPRSPSVTISHRVVEVDAYTGKLVTKGDANAAMDPVASTLAVTGVVHYEVPKAGYVINALRSWLGLSLLVYVPAVLIVAQEMRRLVRTYIVPTYVLRR